MNFEGIRHVRGERIVVQVSPQVVPGLLLRQGRHIPVVFVPWSLKVDRRTILLFAIQTDHGPLKWHRGIVNFWSSESSGRPPAHIIDIVLVPSIVTRTVSCAVR